MSIVVPILKQNNRLEQIHFTICEVGSRKLGNGQSFWSDLAPHLTIIGYDADEDACIIANEEAENYPWQEIHYPEALSSQSTEQTLYVTKAVHCSSLYPPNQPLLSRFSGMNEGIVLDFSVDIETTTLDNSLGEKNINNIDFLQIDVQGADFDVIQGGENLLKNTVLGLKIEVEFSSMYVDQPLFGDIDSYLRNQGFLLFDLSTQDGWCRRPRSCSPIFSSQRIGQLLWADALYFRDPLIPNAHSVTQKPENILKLACLADISGYYDYALELLQFLTLKIIVNIIILLPK
jgi:FkbM family methyltransferase